MPLDRYMQAMPDQKYGEYVRRLKQRSPMFSALESPEFQIPSETFDPNDPGLQEELGFLRDELARRYTAGAGGVLSAMQGRGFRPGSGIEAAGLARFGIGLSGAYGNAAAQIIQQRRMMAFQKLMAALAARRQLRYMNINFHQQKQLQPSGLGSIIGGAANLAAGYFGSRGGSKQQQQLPYAVPADPGSGGFGPVPTPDFGIPPDDYGSFYSQDPYYIQ